MKELMINNITIDTIDFYLKNYKKDDKQHIISNIINLLLDSFETDLEKLKIIASWSDFNIETYNTTYFVDNKNLANTFILLDKLIIGSMHDVAYNYIYHL